MKILLLQDVKGQGTKGQVVDVSDGYARNFLINKKLGKEATKEAINSADRAEKAKEHKLAKEKQEAVEFAKSLDGKNVKVTVKAGETGKLYGALTTKELAEEIGKQLGKEIDKRAIELKEGHIKQLGKYDVILRVYPGITASIVVDLIAE